RGKHMRKNKIVAAAASLTAAALLLKAFGTGADGGSGSAESGDLSTQIAAVTAEQLDGTKITMGRLVGGCEEPTQGVTDPAKATTECQAIQILTNKFNAENEYGITVERLGGTDWNSYYDAFNASVAGGEPANIANLHDYSMSDYATRDQLPAFHPDSTGVDLTRAAHQAPPALLTAR